jgi:hypothetical protein
MVQGCCTALCSAALPLVVAIAPLAAQLERPTCASSASRLETTVEERAYADALGWLRRCPDAGPPAIVVAWSNAPDDRGRLEHLVRTSGAFYDERILTVLLRTLADNSRPTAVRLGAARSLVTQAGHCFMLHEIPVPRPIGDSLYALVSIAKRSHSASVPGGIPRIGDVSTRIEQGLRTAPADRELRAILDGILRSLELSLAHEQCS